MKPSTTARSSVRSSRVFTLWMILMLAFAMLPALPAQDAAAQTPTPTATPVPEVDEGLFEGEAEQEAEPTPTNTVVADAPAPDGRGEITVQKYACEPGYDTSGKLLAELLEDCNTPLSGARYTIPFEAGGQLISDTREDGYLTWQGLAPGGATVLETPPAGYLVARVFCVDRPKVDETSAPSGYQEATLSPENGINVQILADREFHCYWFNIPEPDEDETGTIIVRKYVCPDDYDPSTADLETLQDECPDVQSGVQFEYIVDGGTAVQGTTNQEGIISWTDVDPGEVTIRETPLAGYLVARVFCHVHDSAETNFVTSAYVEIPRVTPNEIAGDLEAGRTIDCIWFNAPVEDEYGTVYVYKYLCHPDFEYEGASREDLESNCTEPQQGVSFGVGAESAPYQEDRTTDSSGLATWEDVPAGPIGILEEPHDGYVLARVYCGVVAQNNATLPASWEEVPYQDGLDYHLPAGEYVHCIFYNAPDDDHGTIVITKYLCGAIQVALDSPGPDYDIFSNQCTDIGVGYVFSLQTTTGDVPGESDGNGEVRWTGLDPGDVTVSETLPTGYESYAVYCTTDPAGTYEEFAAQQETTFDYTVIAGQTLYCSWFNFVPDSNTRVEVVKYLCEPEFDYEAADYPGHLAACTETISGVPFLVYNAAGYNSPKSTDDQGTAVWNSVPAGTISIQETPGVDYQPVKVYCSLSPIEGTVTGVFQGYDLDVVDHFIGIAVQDGESLVCHWFNAPVEVGTVVIYKYTCDSLFATRGAAGYDDYITNCTTPGEGFTYGLYNSADEQVDEQLTGPDGIATLTAADAGTYSLNEVEVPDYQTLALFCTIDLTVPPTTSEEVPYVFDLTPGATLYCYWFNVEYEPSPYDPGSIVIHKYECPPGYPTTPTGGRNPQNHFFLGCQVPESGVDFNVEQGGANVGSGETDATGTAIITGVSAGTTRISELPREGYGPPKVFCANYPATGGLLLFLFQEQTVDNWGHTIDLAEGNILECYWFNFPNSQGADGQPIQIIVHKYLCEAGYDPADKTYETISTECPTAEEAVNFDIGGGDGTTSGGPTDSNGYAEYNGVVPGSISITETPRQGYQTVAVYCTNYITSAGTPSLFPSEEGQLFYYLAPGYKLECYWYNAEAVEHGHVNLIKYICHEDYEYETASREDLFANCPEKHTQVDFTLTGPGGYSEMGTTNADGEAGWEEVRPGAYSLTETPPPGYYPVRIFCTEVPLNGPFPYDSGFTGQWDDYTASPDNILDIELDVRASYWWWCEWYNAPDPEYGTVHVYKYYCPEDYDYSTANRDDLYAACTEAHEGVEYHLAAGEYAEGKTTDPAGYAEWEEVPSGPASITEVPPTGYQPVRVYCGEALSNTATLPSTWQDYPFGSGWTITYPVPVNYFVTCEWYNAPYEEDPPQVWIQKYNCPEEAEQHWNYHQFLSGCHEPGPDVEYGIGPDENSLSLSVTDALGRIILGDLEPGTLVIQESLPTGYAGVVVYCQFVSLHHTGSYQKAEVYDRTIKLQLEDGYVITCVWFNLLEGHAPPAATPPAGGHQPLQPVSSGGTGIPSTGGPGTGTTGGQPLPEVDPNTPANLIITKYTCEPGYDVHLDESVPAVDCAALTDEIGFTLSNEDETDPVELQGVTGDDGEGTVAFNDLAAGPYLLTEELPEGTLSAFIYTCTSDRRDFPAENPFTPFAYAGPDGRIGVTLVPGETLECDWYDVPGDQPGGQVTIIKYACPGTSVIVAQCEIFPGGATIGLFPIGESGELVELVTGQDGMATAAVEGAYTIQEIPTTACLIDSDAFDDAGNLVVNDGDQVEVRVYNCGLAP